MGHVEKLYRSWICIGFLCDEFLYFLLCYWCEILRPFGIQSDPRASRWTLILRSLFFVFLFFFIFLLKDLDPFYIRFFYLSKSWYHQHTRKKMFYFNDLDKPFIRHCLDHGRGLCWNKTACKRDLWLAWSNEGTCR